MKIFPFRLLAYESGEHCRCNLPPNHCAFYTLQKCLPPTGQEAEDLSSPFPLYANIAMPAP